MTNDVNSYSQLTLSADGRTLAALLLTTDSSIAYYDPEGRRPLSVAPQRLTLYPISWANEDRLLFNVPNIAIGSIDRATGSIRNFEIGDIDRLSYIAACRDGHILFTGLPKGAAEQRLFRADEDGGNPIQLTTSGLAFSPVCSPDSAGAYFNVAEAGSYASLWAIPLAGGTPRRLFPGNKVLGGYHFSSDGRFASSEEILTTNGLKVTQKVINLASHEVTHQVLIETSDYGSGKGTFVGFSPDDQALVYSVLREGGRTLLSQPLDGSTSHILFDPVPERILDFAWSPSGKQLAVSRLKSTLDVVLIKDEGKGKD